MVILTTFIEPERPIHFLKHKTRNVKRKVHSSTSLQDQLMSRKPAHMRLAGETQLMTYMEKLKLSYEVVANGSAVP